MANQKQLKIIARNLACQLLMGHNFDSSGLLTEADEEKLQKYVRELSYTLIKKCYVSQEHGHTSMIIKDTLANVK